MRGLRARTRRRPVTVRRVAAPSAPRRRRRGAAAPRAGGGPEGPARREKQKEFGFVETRPSRSCRRSTCSQLENEKPTVDEDELVRLGEAIRSRCAEFGVEGTIEGISPGPVITVFEFQPAPGVKVSQIVNLQDDLALALRAESVRIDRHARAARRSASRCRTRSAAMIRLGAMLADERFRRSPSLLTARRSA